VDFFFKVQRIFLSHGVFKAGFWGIMIELLEDNEEIPAVSEHPF